MFTLTAQDQHGVYLTEEISGDAETALPVRNGTKQGYDLAYPGDGVCLSYPKSESRRGRVGKGCSQTLDTGCMMGTVTKCGKIRRGGGCQFGDTALQAGRECGHGDGGLCGRHGTAGEPGASGADGGCVGRVRGFRAGG